jgi:branched-chain amino acid transport system substrate-binding protein
VGSMIREAFVRYLSGAAVAAALGGEATGAASADEPITIGAILSYTAASAPLGVPQVNALKLAEQTMSAHGGVAGRSVHFDIVDDEGKPDIAAQLASEMVGRNVAAVIYGTRVASAIAISRVVAQSGKLGVYVSPSIQQWQTRAGVAKTIFQTIPSNEDEVQALLVFARSKLRAKSIAILHDENTYGQTISQLMSDRAQRSGLSVLGRESYPGSATDFTAQIERLRQGNPDVFFVLGAAQTPGLAVRQLRTLGVKQPLLGGSGILSQAFINIAGPAAEGVYSDVNLNLAAPRPLQRDFFATYRAAYHELPPEFAADAWDAANLIRLALVATKSNPDGTALANAIENMKPFPGVLGTYRYSAANHNGLSVDNVHIAVVRDGRWTTIG